MELERVQVRLRPEEREAVRCEARRLGISVSEVVRRAIQPLVSATGEVDESDPLWSIVGVADGLGLQIEDDIDEVVYGDPHGDRRRAALAARAKQGARRSPRHRSGHLAG